MCRKASIWGGGFRASTSSCTETKGWETRTWFCCVRVQNRRGQSERQDFGCKIQALIQHSRRQAPSFVLVGSLELLELIGVEKASKLWRFSGLEAMSVPKLLMSQITFQSLVQPFSPTFSPNCPFGYSCSGKGWGDYLMYCIIGNKRSWCFVACQPLLSQELIITGSSARLGELQDPGWCR